LLFITYLFYLKVKKSDKRNGAETPSLVITIYMSLNIYVFNPRRSLSVINLTSNPFPRLF